MTNACIVRDLQEICYKQCTIDKCKCGQVFHCPLCPISKFRGRSEKKVREHVIAVHAGPYMLKKDGTSNLMSTTFSELKFAIMFKV